MNNSKNLTNQNYAIQSKEDTNFRQFSHSPQFRNNFHPQHSSSPLSSRQNFNNSKRRGSPNFQNRTYSSTPYNKYKKFHNYENKEFDVSIYYNTEFTKDPWSDLENQVKTDDIEHIEDKLHSQTSKNLSSLVQSQASCSKSHDQL